MLRENSLQFGIRIPENSYIDEDSIMAEVIDAVDGNLTHHFANRNAGERLGDKQQHAKGWVDEADHHVQHHQYAKVHQVHAQ